MSGEATGGPGDSRDARDPSERNDYDDGHLIVAAVRVLVNRAGRPPTVEEVAEILGFSREVAHHLVRRFEERGIVRAVETPFETRVVVENHLAIEDLPRTATGPTVANEFEVFRDKQRQKQKELDRLFGGESLEKKRKERVSSLDEQFKRFRETRTYRPPAAPPGDEEDGPSREDDA